MSSVFRLAKSKVSQEELRKLMRLKQQEQQKQQETRIDSPLARYEGNQLSCGVCRVAVAPKAWRAHLNSSRHDRQVSAAKQLHRRALDRKRPASPPPLPDPKRIKGILKNAPPRIVEDDLPQPTVRFVDEPQTTTPTPDDEIKNDSNKAELDVVIPEGFFDDPIMDAKARNIQYKNPIEEEWEKFVKEMKEETDLSAAIIAGEQEEATADRQIDEIEEQMRNLSKVLDLNRKKEEAASRKASEAATSVDCDRGTSDEDENFEEYLDWRAKKSYR